MVPKVLVLCDHVCGSARRSPCPSETCVAYIKWDVVGARALGKSKCRFRHKRTKATQQDLCNHIQPCKANGISYICQKVKHCSTFLVYNDVC